MEAIRLVVWDLDEVFWGGTLCEGGLIWRPENAETVVELARRGIISSICSKNDAGAVEKILRDRGLADFFVFCSVDWAAKGPRLAELVQKVQLRPETILFIEDHPGNRAEAARHVPGLQVADETILPYLLSNPRLRGRPDPGLERLTQYRLLEQRQAAAGRLGGSDSTGFLRDSGITVSIEFDVAAQLDRAIELINRTNQLNFTKARLPEDQERARAALKRQLSGHNVSAGILRVRDKYGDYGFCGLYVMRAEAGRGRPRVLHFAFSCRILGMGIERWLYRHLNRPDLQVTGEVVADLEDESPIDWISLVLPGVQADAAGGGEVFSYVLARGGCDMRALAHYLDMISGRVVEEIAEIRDGTYRLNCSSVLAAQALHGTPAALVRDSRKLSFKPEDFETLIAAPPAGQAGLWLLNFTLEQPIPLLRHKETGWLLPAWIQGIKGPPRDMLRVDPQRSGLDPELVAHLRDKFEMVGPTPDDIFQDSLRTILRQAPREVRVFILLANQQARQPDGTLGPIERMWHRNDLVKACAAEFPGVTLLAPGDFMSEQELLQLEQPHHYDRVVYYRMFQRVIEVVQADGRGARAAA